MVVGLVVKLEDNFDNLDGWVMLVWFYLYFGEMDKVCEVFEMVIFYFVVNLVIVV